MSEHTDQHSSKDLTSTSSTMRAWQMLQEDEIQIDDALEWAKRSVTQDNHLGVLCVWMHFRNERRFQKSFIVLRESDCSGRSRFRI